MFFNIFKKAKQNTKNELDNIIKGYSATAVDYAKDFNKKFNYSPKSIEELEEILDFYSKDIPVSKPTDNQIWSMSIIFGSYLGETLLKNGMLEKGYSWEKEDPSHIPLLIGKDGWHVTPVDKVYKRLVNGNEDNIVSFYKVALKELL